ncbi:unnamed protein product [Trichogramma brassicae]|uniref:Uncharacterized protein n=1 Tax=Trichogramma brassicae TaxID=86971 RepID=A0A6H5J5H9_9HYME|nr:unnamed protein product [Trichogramma brassicae]
MHFLLAASPIFGPRNIIKRDAAKSVLKYTQIRAYIKKQQQQQLCVRQNFRLTYTTREKFVLVCARCYIGADISKRLLASMENQIPRGRSTRGGDVIYRRARALYRGGAFVGFAKRLKRACSLELSSVSSSPAHRCVPGQPLQKIRSQFDQLPAGNPI